MPRAQPLPAARGPLRLSVVALRDPNVKEERFSIRTYLDEGGRPTEDTPEEPTWTRDAVAQLIHRRLRKKKGPYEVELFLEEDLLAEGIGAWTIRVDDDQRDPIDAVYPVKLRSWDRYDPAEDSDFDEQVATRWEDLWQKLPGGPQACLAVEHLAELYDPKDYGRALREMLRRAGPLCLAASLAPPMPGAEVPSPRKTLHSLLVAGTPVALWPAPARSNGADPMTLRDALKTFVLKQHPDRLAGLVSQRRDTLGTDPDPLRHLCLLWDDPNRRLPSDGRTFDPPGYPGSFDGS
jgi:hypothetical protein